MLALILTFVLTLVAPTAAKNELRELRHACDISAGVQLDTARWVTANDENQLLYIYHPSNSSPVDSVDLSAHLAFDHRKQEVDLEAAAARNDTIFWIGSHSTNKKGKLRPSRHALAATWWDGARLNPVGQVYRDLAKDLALLDSAIFGNALVINLEGMAQNANGELLLGFREPLVNEQAMIVILSNPLECVQGEKALLQEPILLDLGGQAIRSLEYDAQRQVFWIIGGPSSKANPDPLSGPKFSLWKWSGKIDEHPQRMDLDLGNLNPEALFVVENSLIIISDDGAKNINGVECKKLPAYAQKTRYLRWEIPGSKEINSKIKPDNVATEP